MGELIGYSWSGVRPSSSIVVRRSQCSNIFFFKTACPIKAKFYVEPYWVGGTKVCSRHVGHMTKMAAMPIYGNSTANIKAVRGSLWSCSVNKLSHIPKLQSVSAVYKNQ